MKKAHNSTWTHRKAIPNSRMLVSLNHCWTASANLAIFNISQNGDVRKVYSFEEVMGGKNIQEKNISLLITTYLCPLSNVRSF